MDVERAVVPCCFHIQCIALRAWFESGYRISRWRYLKYRLLWYHKIRRCNIENIAVV